MVQVTYPWNDNVKAFSGIPPHIALMEQVAQVLDKQTHLVKEFIVEMEKTLTAMGIDGDRMSAASIKEILKNFEESFLSRIGQPLHSSQIIDITDVDSKRVENIKAYTVHYYRNTYKRVPEDWRFPRCGIADVWRHWWIGDLIRMVPPLRFLTIIDVKHLDETPLDEEEKHGRRGKNKTRRRKARKTLTDLAYLMNFVKNKVVSRGKYEVEITIAAVDRMFQSVVDCFDINERDTQKRWTTIVNDVRNKKVT